MDSSKQEFDCPICQQLITDAVETDCCANIFCEQCLISIQQRTDKCPLCRKQGYKFDQSRVIRKIIGKMEQKCEFCSQMVQVSERSNHLNKCESRKYICQQNGCGFQGLKKDFLTHCVQNHTQVILDTFEGKQQQKKFMDPTEYQVNSKNLKPSKQGQNGKFYCGQKLENGKCQCCDGNCGPTNGCNCIGCSVLDLQLRNLPMKGYLVNKEGRVSKQVTSNGRFFCGGRIYGGNCGVGMSVCTPCEALVNVRYQQFRI